MEAKIKSIMMSIAWKYFGTALYIIAIVAGIGPLYHWLLASVACDKCLV